MSVAISYYLQNSGIYNTVLCTQYPTQLEDLAGLRFAFSIHQVLIGN